MALVNATISKYGLEVARQKFPAIRDAAVAISVPDQVAVNKAFVKVQVFEDKVSKADIPTARKEGRYPFKSSVAFREFVAYHGLLGLALKADDNEVRSLMQNINYFGKRGCFFQCTSLEVSENLPDGFTLLTEPAENATMGTPQVMDDIKPDVPFENISIYDNPKNDVRKPNMVVLPMVAARSTYTYTLYRKVRIHTVDESQQNKSELESDFGLF